MANRLFADISSNNKTFNAYEYARGGHRLIGIKATEGQSYGNEMHAHWTHDAHAAGLLVAHYHFCRPATRHDVVAEARSFWRHVAPHFETGDILVIDLEVQVPAAWASRSAYLTTFERLIRSHAGVDPYIYCGLAYLEESKPPLLAVSRKFWIADYGRGVGRLGHHRHRWAIQYTDGKVGTLPHKAAGIGQCDISRLTAVGSADLTMRRRRRRRAGLKVAR